MLIRSILKTVAFCSLGLFSMAAAAQQFKQPLVIATGNWPAGVVAADLNGDGKADLIYTDYGATPTASTTHVLVNRGDGTFAPGQTITTAGAAIAAADFDHDGRVDLAWVSGVVGEGKVYLARGNGDGTFAAAQMLGTFAIVGTNSPVFRYVMGAQLHDTGYLDLLVEDVANPSLLTLTTDGSGTLVRIVGTKLQTGIGPMAAADLNGDGHTDLVIQSVSSGTANVFLGSTDGLLTEAGAYAGSSAVQSMLLHDVDGDGHPDLVVEGLDGQIEILHGNVDGSFAATSEGGSRGADATTGIGGHLVAVTDAGARHSFYTTTPAGMSVLLEQSDLSLSLQGIYNAGPGRGSFAVADFNGDGVPDVAVDSPEGVAIVLGSADGSLSGSRSFSAGKPALSGAVGNFSGSGNLDAVVNVTAAQSLLLHGNGDGTFGTVTPTTLLAGASSEALPVRILPGAPQAAWMVQAAVVTVDLDGDGNADVIVAYDNVNADHAHPTAATANAIYIWYGKNDGTFEAPMVMTPSRNFYEMSAVDLNGDGRPDLVMSDGYVISVQSNLGGRTFGAETHYLAGMGINSISAGDLNKDGFTDLLIANGGAVFSNSVISQKATTTPDVNTGGITVLLNTGKVLVPTTTVLAITPPLTIPFGQTVTGTAQVSANDGSPLTGTITFYDGTTTLCTIAVVQSGSCPANAGAGFAAGTHVLTAAYSGDATHLGSISAAITVVVLAAPATKAQTKTTLTSDVNPATSGQSVTFIANVAAIGVSVAAPSGVVTFLDGSIVLGTKTLVGSGVASFSTSSLSVGNHSITVSYAGDANSFESVSTVLTETVNGTATAGSAFSVSVMGAAKVGVGGVANLQVSVAPQTGYTQPVQLSCADLPSEAACTFAAHTIPAGGGTTALQISTMAPRSCEVTDSGSQTASLPFAGTAIAALLVLFVPGRRRAIKGLLVALLALGGMATLNGCGSCTDLGTKPGTYTIRVIGTSTGVTTNVVTTKVQVIVSVE